MAHSPDHSLDSFSGTPSAVPSGPPWPNPLASIAYASCRPADCEPPAEDSALTSQAAYERLNRAAARAETLVLYRLDMLAGCRDSLDVDQIRLEQSIQNLWRLTAVRKTLMSIESALIAPTPTPSDNESPSPSPSCSQSELALSSQSQSRSHSQSIPSTGSTGSTPSMESLPPVPQSPSPQVSPSSSVAPSPARPLAPASSLSIGSVPACPRLSLSSVARTLGRVNADMANYTEYVSTAADYNSNLTAEEFLRPSCSPKSSHIPTLATTAINSATAAGDEETTLLADPALSPPLKFQISAHKSSSSPSNAIPHSKGEGPVGLRDRIPHSPRPPD